MRQQCRFLNSFVAMVLLFPRNFGANPTVAAGTGCKSTLSRKARRRAKANTTTRKEIARPARPTRALQTSTRAKIEAELDIVRRTARDQVEERTTIPPVTTATPRKARVTKKSKEKANKWTLWKQISLLKQPQPCRIWVHSFTPVRSRIQDKRYRCLILESTLQVEHDSRTIGDIQTSRRTNNSSAFPRVCSSATNSVSWLSRSARVLE